MLGAFQRVVIASDTMIHLLEERRRVRFHQPSRVKKAEDIRDLIDHNLLVSIQSTVEPPKWLVEEVGSELANLLEFARQEKGFVIRPFPIYKLSTFLEKEAEIGEYSEILIFHQDLQSSSL